MSEENKQPTAEETPETQKARKATAAEPLQAGTVCVVEKLDGVTLTVRPK